MKKLFVVMCAALLSMGAQAQEKGDFAVGVHGSAYITTFEIEDWDVDESSTQMGFGVFGQYSLSKHWRVELEGTYHPMKDHVSDFFAGLNVHYLFHLNETFKIYPMVGYGLDFVHSETFTEGNTTIEGDDATDSGVQIGAGVQANLKNNWFVLGEYKYQPGIFGDGHIVQIGVGYRF